MRFLLAIVVAVLGGLWHWDRPLKRLKWAWWLFLDYRHGKHVPKPIQRARMAYCELCPIFYRPLRTCGTPLRNHMLGCWCYQPFKTRIATSTCWINTHGNTAKNGWPKELYAET